MKLATCVLSLWICSAADSQEVPTFEEFVVQFEKKYSDADELNYRRSVYIDNVDKIVAHNARGNAVSYRLAVNAFADLTQSEFRAKHLGHVTSAGKLLGASPQFHLGTQAYSGVALPEEVDWTNSTTAVKNQGHCGSCYAFSATGAMEAREFLHRKGQGKILDLAEQQIVDCSRYTGNEGCDGGEMDSVFDYVKTHGICSEADYPYKAHEEKCHETKCTPVISPNALVGFVDVPPRDSQALMEALSHGPVAVAIEADDQAFQFYHSGVLKGNCGDNLDHGVLAVGYGVTAAGETYWKVKNSWGTAWGDHGYILLDRAEEGSGECGILMAASFPVFEGQTLPRLAEPYGPTPCPDASGRPIALPEAAGYSFCAPPCATRDACPAVASAKGARPMCALQDPASDEHYCALLCKAGAGGCQSGAECVPVQGSIGLCMFKDPKNNYQRPPFLPLTVNWATAEDDFVVEMVEF